MGRTLLLTSLALVAFAANSLLCRVALSEEAIDPVAFTAIRLVSGAVALAPLFWRAPSSGAGESRARGTFDGLAAAALLVYAFAFSLAYVSLDAGVGALLLFGSVQVTMLVHGYRTGERMGPVQIGGAVLAAAGLVTQVFPGLTAPDPKGASLMCLSGAAWGVYSLRGRGGRDPFAATARNFLAAAPVALLALVVAGAEFGAPRGIWLAVASGAVTSGMGYVVWYLALPRLSATVASLVQLAVPPLAAVGGMLVLGEVLTARFTLAAVMILGGIAAAVTSRPR